MAVAIEWLDERHNCIVVTIQGGWEWEEVMRHLEQVWAMARAADQDVALIYDLDYAAWRFYPPLDLVKHMYTVYHAQPRNLTPIVAVAEGRSQLAYAQLLLQTLAPLVPQLRSTRLAASMEEALAFIDGQRITQTIEIRRLRINDTHPAKTGR